MSTDQQGDVTLHGLRGATSVAEDTPAAIVERTGELLREMLDHNGLTPDEVVSVIFTSTKDLTSEFPAAAARDLGMVATPLLCAAEIDVPAALPRCIRILMHAHLRRSARVRHVYLHEAERLRVDLSDG